MQLILDTFIEGRPAPGGSKTAMPVRRKDGSYVEKNRRLILNYVESSKYVAKWRKAVADQAMAVYREPVLKGSVGLFLMFYLVRPQAHWNKYDLKPSAPRDHLQKPDLTKLLRSTEDALTGVIWKDDCDIVRTAVGKDWTKNIEDQGAHVRVYDLTDQSLDLSLWEAEVFKQAHETQGA